MIKKTSLLIFYTILLIILTSVTAFIGGHKLKFIVSFISFLLFIYLVSKKNKTIYFNFYIILFTYIIFHLLLLFYGGLKLLMVSHLSTLSGILGLFFGVVLLKQKNSFKFYVTITLSLLLLLWVQVIGYDLWIHKVNYGTFFGVIKAEKIKKDVLLFNSKKQIILSLKQPDKIILLDFWNSHCGACFKKFPLLDKFSKKTKKNIEIFAVNVPYKNENLENSLLLLKERGYSFNNLFISNSDASYLKIAVFPTVLVIENGEILFKGSLEKSIDFIINDLY